MKKKFVRTLTGKMKVSIDPYKRYFEEIKKLKDEIESLESKIKRMREERKGSRVAVG